MIDLKLDANGDIAFENSDLVLVKDADEVAQQLRIKLRFILGECAFNSTLGIDYFNQVFVGNPNISVVEAMLKKAILSVDGINNLISFALSYDRKIRTLNVAFSCDTIYGQVNLKDIHVGV